MVNPGICRRCANCKGIDDVERDEDGNLIRIAIVDCALSDCGIVPIDGNVPDGCPYILEHVVTDESTEVLAENWKEEFEERHAIRL